MREIKFRVWTGNSMWSPEYRANWEMLRDAEDEPHSVIMQFTGLTDRHGKEIYEGDIVTDDADEDGWKYEVIFENASFWAVHKSQGKVVGKLYPNGLCSDIELIEVIGNIYENKELLK